MDRPIEVTSPEAVLAARPHVADEFASRAAAQLHEHIEKSLTSNGPNRSLDRPEANGKPHIKTDREGRLRRPSSVCRCAYMPRLCEPSCVHVATVRVVSVPTAGAVF